jgi:hypothetical protein
VQRGNAGLGVQSAGAAEQQHYFRFSSAARVDSIAKTGERDE